jgi:3-(3-hydroxy-phenyl)propionate hydroxylase
MSRRQPDVAVVGLGPVGAVLAGLLGRRGLDVVVVERDTDVFALPRAAHIDHTGLRALQELGCLDAVLPSTIPNPGIDFVGSDRQLLMRLPADQSTWSGVPTSVYFHQPGFDRALRASVGSLPSVEVRLQTEVVGLETDDDGVLLRVRRHGDADSGAGVEELRASYVVGCDGAASTVREAAGIQLEDLGFDEQWLVVDLLVGEPRPDLPERAVYVCDPRRPHVVIPMPGNRHRIEFMLLPGEDPATMQRPDTLDRLLRDLVDAESVEIERAAVYTFHGLVAQPWRKGRVFIAGDAAHQMPPFLGQGMCSGFRDATNLAWKLDHVIRRGAPDVLLDSYEQERSPHVREIVIAAVDYGALVGTLDPVAAAERDRQLVHDHSALLFGLPPLPRGPLVQAGGGGLFGQPTIGGRLLDDVVGTRFLVLGRDEAALGQSGAWWADATGALVTTLDQLPDPDPSLQSWFDRQGAAAAILRPDRYLLAATNDLDAVTAIVRDLLEPFGSEPASSVHALPGADR